MKSTAPATPAQAWPGHLLAALPQGGAKEKTEGRADKLPIQEKEQVNERRAQAEGRVSGPEQGPSRSAALCRRLLQRLDPLVRWAKQKPQTAAAGEFLYNVGFWGEYTALRACRMVRAGTKNLGARLLSVLKKIGSYLGGALLTGWRELTAPFTRFWSGIKNINALIKQEKQQTGRGHALKEGLLYFGRGVRLYFPLLRASVAYVIPVCALALFVYTVNAVLSYNYILAVEVDGQVVGYVENEQVFDSAKAEVAQRIKPVEGEEVEWSITPSYTLAVSDYTLDENAMADAILQASSSEIVPGTALYVNDQLVAVTTEGEKLEQAIEAIKAPYEDPGNENLRVEFNKDVRVDEGIYLTSHITDCDNIVELLHGEEQGQVSYTIKGGDTPSGVASQFGLSTQQLQGMNPEYDMSEYFRPGDELLISRAQPYLEVRRIEKVTTQEEISYPTEERNANDLAFGKTRVVQEGETGLDEVTYENVYYGDSATADEVNEIERVTLKAPVTRVIDKGTKLPDGQLAQTGSGSLRWPVPNYTYVSRWMSGYHKGADICAAYGSPIVAADSGVVVTAGYHYSYGNYVVIDHGNGYRTLYAHASRLAVSYGQAVSQGQVIAYVGSTGNSTGNHCHFEVYVNGVRRSAREWFPGMRTW